VFVAGASYGGRATGVDYKTVAYSAAAGRQLWVSRYHGPGNMLTCRQAPRPVPALTPAAPLQLTVTAAPARVTSPAPPVALSSLANEHP